MSADYWNAVRSASCAYQKSVRTPTVVELRHRHMSMANCKIPEHFVASRILVGCAVRDLAVLFLHLLATVARLAGPGGARSVVAESVLVKHQLLTDACQKVRLPNPSIPTRDLNAVRAVNRSAARQMLTSSRTSSLRG
jgi:hypothetical protein